MSNNTTSTAHTSREVDARAIIETVKDLHGVQILERDRHGRGDKVSFAVIPNGMEVQSLKDIFDEYAPKPERAEGTAKLADEASFVEHVNRFNVGDGSLIFASATTSPPQFLAVYDYHARNAPDWLKHRALWQLQLSTEWKAWHAQASKPMSHAEFAEFLERHVPDVYWGDTRSDYTNMLIQQLELRLATPSQLVALSRNLAVNVDSAVKSAQTLSSGEISVQYVEQHRDGDGAPIKVPNAFLIAIPVVPNGPSYQVLVRLRYRVQGGKVTWYFDLHRVDLVFETAFKEICARVAQETGVKVVLGSPEA